MNGIRTKLWITGVVMGLMSATFAAADETKSITVGEPHPSARIQLAILLDTSGSMSGLINQTRTQLWKIVNELATAKRNGQEPSLEVALYEYGKSSLPAEEGFLRMIVPFTDDLDRLSEELFALSTNGGSEYCGQVIASSLAELKWSDSHDDLKLIFIAGNEPFSQGPVDYKQSCAAAIKKGITVNTIFCGPLTQGIQTGWQDGAQLADGSFLNIDQNRAVAVVVTPFDEELARLSTSVNKTYVAFGDREERERLSARQSAQDSLAKEAAPAAAAERAAFKGSGHYKATAWDLIDAIQAGKVKLADIKDEKLPKEMRKMSLDKKNEYVAKKQAERKAIQAKLKTLAAERKKYIAEERKKQSKADANDTLDAAIITTIRTQARQKKFEFDKN